MSDVSNRRGPTLLQHKSWQQARAPKQRGEFSAFHPLDVVNGPWKDLLGTIGSGIGNVAGTGLGEMLKLGGIRGKAATGVLSAEGQKIGSSAGQEIGFLIDNAHSITQNVLTVFANPLQSFADLDLDNYLNDQGGNAQP